MRSAGPLWALVMTIDRNLLLALATANLGFAIASAALLFRGRPLADRALITAGIFAIVTALSVLGLYGLARVPIREVQVFLLD